MAIIVKNSSQIIYLIKPTRCLITISSWISYRRQFLGSVSGTCLYNFPIQSYMKNCEATKFISIRTDALIDG